MPRSAPRRRALGTAALASQTGRRCLSVFFSSTAVAGVAGMVGAGGGGGAAAAAVLSCGGWGCVVQRREPWLGGA